MVLLGDAVIAVLAAVGLASLIWLSHSLLQPRRSALSNTLALVIAHGSAEELEQDVRTLARLRREERLFSRIVIFDGGMDEEARKRARLLCREVSGVELVQNIKTNR